MKPFFALFFLLGSVTAYAQSYTLAYYKGNVEVTYDGSSWNNTTAIGITLGKTGSIRLGEKAEAIFTNAQKETIYLSKPGTYSTGNFSNYIVSADKSSLSVYYLNFIVQQITHTDASVEKNYKEQLKNKGGVSRANNYRCLQGPVNATYVLDSTIRFSWNNFSRNGYTLIIYNDIDKNSVKVKQTVKDTFFVFNRFASKFEAGKTYYWTVTADNVRPCEIFSFSVITKEEQQKVILELNNLKLNMDYTGGMQEAIIGKFFELKGLYENARKCYIKACALEPESDTFKSLLRNFDNSILAKQ